MCMAHASCMLRASTVRRARMRWLLPTVCGHTTIRLPTFCSPACALHSHKACRGTMVLTITLSAAYRPSARTGVVQRAQSLHKHVGAPAGYGFFDFTDAATAGITFDQRKSGCAAISGNSGHTWHAPASRSRRTTAGAGRHMHAVGAATPQALHSQAAHC